MILLSTQIPLRSLVVFGSHARGDDTPTSDVDLFGLRERGRYRLIEHEKIRLSVYSEDAFLRMVDQGALFVWHLKAEGHILYDYNRQVRRALAGFELKGDYSRERREAALVGWLLSSPEALEIEASLLNRLAIFSLRTVCYTHLAERALPRFARSDVLEVMADPLIDEIWSAKHHHEVLFGLRRQMFFEFLRKYGAIVPAWRETPFANIYRHRLPKLVRSRLRTLMGASKLYETGTY